MNKNKVIRLTTTLTIQDDLTRSKIRTTKKWPAHLRRGNTSKITKYQKKRKFKTNRK
jgi:hypothetical protein